MTQKSFQRFVSIALAVWMLLAAALACTQPGSKTVIEVSATPPRNAIVATLTPPPFTPIRPTPNPVRFNMELQDDGTYSVQPGDTLALIAARFSVSVEALVALNGIIDANTIEVGQILQIPSTQVDPGTSFKIVPDSELVYGPSVSGFDLDAFVTSQPGFLRTYTEDVNGDGVYVMTGVEIINEIAVEYSVSPRILLAILEYRSKWLSQLAPSGEALQYPMGYIDPNRQGLYRQAQTVANLLNEGYYGWRYRRLTSMAMADSSTLVFAPELNAGTVAVQYLFAKYTNRDQWGYDVSDQGLYLTYLRLFGDPFRNATEPLVPVDLEQPTLTLPFAEGETWYYTGGPHGGFASGSAWAAVDFAPPAPPDELIVQQGYCYISPFAVTAVANGVIARSGSGYVVLDLDGDGNEHTGWNIVYLHISSQGVVPIGTTVNTGDALGYPSCEGGVSAATHLHISRRYNGEWIPADCELCPDGLKTPPFIMSEWRVFLTTGEYQGTMLHIKTSELRRAEQGRDNPINQLNH